jgi:hypothetical protein
MGDPPVMYLGQALKKNQNNVLAEIDLSGNPKIGDKGMSSLADV